jgi:hypothetical protein
MSLNYVAASVHYGSSRQQGTEEGLGEVVREACGHAAAAADACKQLTRKQQQLERQSVVSSSSSSSKQQQQQQQQQSIIIIIKSPGVMAQYLVE